MKAIKDEFLPTMDDNDGGEILCRMMSLIRKIRHDEASGGGVTAGCATKADKKETRAEGTAQED